MSRRYISELEEGELVEGVFLVRSKDLREARSGALFIKAVVADRTGSIDAVMWDASEKIFDSFKTNDFVKVRGRVDMYQDKPQLRIDSVRYVDESGVDPSEFVPSTPRDSEELVAQLLKAAREIKQPQLRELVLSFLEDGEFVEKLKRTPAAARYHHPYLGGLVEHTARVVELARLVSEAYPELDHDILLAGAILHDIGKVEELEAERTVRYTDRGELLGHIVLGAIMVDERARRIEGFPDELLNIMEHIIVSHHGEREYGSPKLPLTPEALAVHFMDDLDAKVFASTRAIREDTDHSSRWTAWSQMFQRRMYKGPTEEEPD